MEEYMLPIKTLKIYIDNHNEIPYQTLNQKKKKKKKKSYHKFYQKTHAIKSMPYKE